MFSMALVLTTSVTEDGQALLTAKHLAVTQHTGQTVPGCVTALLGTGALLSMGTVTVVSAVLTGEGLAVKQDYQDLQLHHLLVISLVIKLRLSGTDGIK